MVEAEVQLEQARAKSAELEKKLRELPEFTTWSILQEIIKVLEADTRCANRNA